MDTDARFPWVAGLRVVLAESISFQGGSGGIHGLVSDVTRLRGAGVGRRPSRDPLELEAPVLVKVVL
jgi:hypothetical protein